MVSKVLLSPVLSAFIYGIVYIYNSSRITINKIIYANFSPLLKIKASAFPEEAFNFPIVFLPHAI